MPWLQVRFPAEREQAQRLGDALEEVGAMSVSIEHVDSGNVWIESDWDEMPVWLRSRVTALFPEHTDVRQVLDQLRQFGVEPPVPTTHLLADEDWESSWKENYHPLKISERLWICPSWLTPPDPKAVNVILDPGMAFGTGDHPTTALCLEWLAELDCTNKDVIDYGCGSGILSIAALKLGARSALGVDIDPQALDVSRRNMELNGVSERFMAYLPPDHNFAGSGIGRASARPEGGHATDGAPHLPAGSTADIVIANILARPLVGLAPQIMACVRPGGRLALSGMLHEQEEMVRPHYESRFTFERRQRGDWILLAGQKRH